LVLGLGAGLGTGAALATGGGGSLLNVAVSGRMVSSGGSKAASDPNTQCNNTETMSAAAIFRCGVANSPRRRTISAANACDALASIEAAFAELIGVGEDITQINGSTRHFDDRVPKARARWPNADPKAMDLQSSLTKQTNRAGQDLVLLH
jgi:hypothetical protein